MEALIAREPQVGDKVYVFGTPYGVFQSVFTVGKIIGHGKSPFLYWSPPIDVHIHDASTSPGSSGGPIVNKYGELVGIHFAGQSDHPTYATNYNFAVPIRYYEQLRAREYALLRENLELYTLWDDFHSFATEENDSWKPVLNWISNRKFTNPKTGVFMFNNEVIPALNRLIQQVESNYPRYSEVIELKRLYLELLYSFREQPEAILYAIMNPNPFLDYNSYLNELQLRTNQKIAAYFNKYEALRNSLQ